MRFSIFATSLLSMATSAMATDANVHADVAVDASVRGFSCPKGMSYCPWTRACACPPGQSWDWSVKTCKGEEIIGAWPEPDVEVYASVDVKLATYCAASPYKIAVYDPKHEYCQAGLNTITFCASLDIEAEIAHLGHGVEVNVEAGISAELHNICAGLSGLYLESVVDAVVLFNTNKFSLARAYADIAASVDTSATLLKTAKSAACRLGLGHCNYDCVSYCTEGCHNYIDVVGHVGGHIKGLAGLCILPDVVLIVNSTGKVVAVVIEKLLCIVGHIVQKVFTLFDCYCS